MVSELLPREYTYRRWSDAMNRPENKDRPIQVVQVTEETLRTIIQESVQEFMTRMGMEYEDPTEMQKDFAHLREWRTTVDSMKRKGVLAAVTIIFTGLASLVVMGLKGTFHIGG